MATAKKPAAKARTATRSRSAKAKARSGEVSPLVTFLVMAFTGLSVVFAIVAYVYYG